MATMKNARLLLDNPNLYIHMRRIKVSIWKSSDRCNKCLDKGHKAFECKGKTVCKHCSGDHLSYNCNSARDPRNQKCAVCARSQKEFKHRADVDTCPTLKLEALSSVNKTVAEIMTHHG